DLDIFRGPLDLLLYLVERNEVDIFDIPIARITEQYLRYLEVLHIIDPERVGEFVVMASTLMEIKSRLLLPHDSPEGAVEEDPRLGLVRQLVEYRKYKEAAQRLEELAHRQAARFARRVCEKPSRPSDPSQEAIRPVEIWDLVSAFCRLLRETLALQAQRIVYDETPTQVFISRILQRLAQTPRLPFREIFEPPHTRGRLVGFFLALLELIKTRQVLAEQTAPFGEIWLIRVTLTENLETASNLTATQL
ncbi:MAG: segregation/condensation protein A, partial [Gemmatales bacterium]|nr:segregation/condensation protein A [Gemmatales bacterium]MDW8176884.1 segregation/condensation protein A [Gemmatales bacterium]